MTLRINEAALQQILQAYSPKGKAGAGGSQQAGDASSANRGDEITLSSAGQELQRMIRTAQQSDGIRSDRVLELQQKLRTGGYLIDPQLIANKMLGLSGGDSDS
jgi:negative regulator of flagellin synthesis FlgM